MGSRTDRSAADAEATARVETYLAGLPGDQGDALRALRAVVIEAVAEAVDGVSYGIPALRYRGRPLVAYRATAKHCALYPMGPEAIEAHRGELDGFDLDKGTIRFTPERPLPSPVVASIARHRKAAIDTALGDPEPPLNDRGAAAP